MAAATQVVHELTTATRWNGEVVIKYYMLHPNVGFAKLSLSLICVTFTGTVISQFIEQA